MATQTLLLAQERNATLEIDYDDVQLVALAARVDTRNATGPVRVTVYADDGVTERLNEVFQPGALTQRSIPQPLRPTFEFQQFVRPFDGVTVTLMSKPIFRFDGA
jgi:hypothetical protein